MTGTVDVAVRQTRESLLSPAMLAETIAGQAGTNLTWSLLAAGAIHKRIMLSTDDVQQFGGNPG
jgi:hypothetical protein